VYDDLHLDICNLLNLWFAFKNAAAGRRKNPSVAQFENRR